MSYIPENPEFEELDNPLRAIVVVNSPSVPDGSMDERLLDTVQTSDEMNDFFDDFDKDIAYPNEGHVKYEAGSDGLVIIVVDSTELKEKCLKWLDDFIDSQTETKNEEEKPSKKSKPSNNH